MIISFFLFHPFFLVSSKSSFPYRIFSFLLRFFRRKKRPRSPMIWQWLISALLPLLFHVIRICVRAVLNGTLVASIPFTLLLYSECPHLMCRASPVVKISMIFKEILNDYMCTCLQLNLAPTDPLLTEFR